jgi:ribose transport system permease protein
MTKARQDIVPATTGTAEVDGNEEADSGALVEEQAARRSARAARSRRQRQSLATVAAIVVLPIVFTLINSHYVSAGNIQSIGRQVAVLLLIAAAGTAPILMGSIDLSVGAMVSLTAVIAGEAAKTFGQIGVFVVLPLGFVLGLINGLIVSRLKLPSFLVTLGTSFVFAGLALIVSGGFPVTLTLKGPVVAHLLDGNLTSWLSASLLWALAFWGLAILVLRRTVFGRYVYAIGGNERAALGAGLPVARTKTLAFAMGGVLCAMAGILTLFETSAATASIGSSYLLTSIAAIVVGGTPLSGGEGGVGRGIIGALVLTELVNGMLIAGLSSAAQEIVEGAVVVAAVLLTLDRRRLSVVK